MPRITGLEIADPELRAVVLDGTPGNWKVVGVYRSVLPEAETPEPTEDGDDAPVPKDRAEFVREHIDAFFGEHGLDPERVIISIDSGNALFRTLSIPLTNEDQIRRTAPFQLEAQVHNFSVEELIIDFIIIEQSEKNSTLLSAAVPKARIAETLGMVQGLGIDPMRLDLDVNGVFGALQAGGVVEGKRREPAATESEDGEDSAPEPEKATAEESAAPEEALLVVYGGPRFAKLILVEGTQPTAIRSIRFDLPDNGGNHAREKALDLLGREANRFLLSAATGSVRGFVLIGDFDGERDLARLITDATKIPLIEQDWTENLEVANAEQRHQLRRYGVAALGLAAEAVGVDPIGMDFRQQEFRYVKRFDAVKKTAAASLFLVIGFCAMFLMHFGGETATLRDNVKTVEQEMMDSYRRSFPNAGRIQNRDFIVDSAESEFKRFVAKYGLGKAEGSLPGSALEFYRQLASAMARMQSDLVKDKKEFRLDLSKLEIKMETERFLIKGDISERWVADRLVEELSRFDNVVFDQAGLSTDFVKDNLEMTMNGKLIRKGN